MRGKASNMAENPKYDGYQHGLISVVFKFLDKKSSLLARSKTIAMGDEPVYSSGIKNENILNIELAEELHKPIIRKFKKENYTHPL